MRPTPRPIHSSPLGFELPPNRARPCSCAAELSSSLLLRRRIEMDSRSSSPSQIADVKMNISPSTSGAAGNKICRGASCDFSDSSTASKDAKERTASMRKLIIAMLQPLPFLCSLFGQLDGKQHHNSHMDFSV